MILREWLVFRKLIPSVLPFLSFNRSSHSELGSHLLPQKNFGLRYTQGFPGGSDGKESA